MTTGDHDSHRLSKVPWSWAPVPQAPTFCAYLLAVRPDWSDRLPSWIPTAGCTNGPRRFSRLGITVLRSPCVHHPDPDPYALHNYARHQPDQLIGGLGASTAVLLTDFCEHLIRRSPTRRGTPLWPCHRDRTGYERSPNPSRASQRLSRPRRHRRDCQQPGETEDPRWARSSVHTSSRVRHADDIDVSTVTPGQRIAIVGGGLTAAQLALAAFEAGANVTLLSRSPLRASATDIDPAWLGSYLLGPFFAEPNWERREACYLHARRGTMPDVWSDKVRHLVTDKRFALFERAVITDFEVGTDEVALTTNDGSVIADRLWLATGWHHDVRLDPLLAPLAPDVTSTGLPVVDSCLRLPGSPIHLMGALAALQVGPAAPNLAGARIAAERIVASLAGIPSHQYPFPDDPEGRRLEARTGPRSTSGAVRQSLESSLS